MFTNISLCPGGAMMMHESVAEFDANAVNPMESEGVQNKISAELKSAGHTYCPIEKVVHHIEPLYERVKGLMKIDLRPDSVEDAIESLDEISEAATEIAECMRMMMVKQNAIYCYINSNDDAWVYEPIKDHLGFFIKNYSRLISMGYGTVVVNVEDFPALDMYSVERALNLYTASLEGSLPSYPFDISRVYALTSYDKGQNVFLDTEDLFKCMIEDPERRSRLSHIRVNNHELEGLISRCSHRFADCCADDFSRRVSTTLITHISSTLRLIKQGCYDLQCELMNGPIMEPGQIHGRLRPLIAGTADLLYLPAVYLIAMAYRLKCATVTKEAMEDYVDQVLTAMKASD